MLILKFLHCCDEAEDTNVKDPLRKIRPILDLLQNSFRSCLHPHQKLVIDESLILFKGRLVFKQYIPTKRHGFGIKLFVLCDCKTGIILDFFVYIGTDVDFDTPSELEVSGGVVKKLMDPYLDKGHILYTDNWCTLLELSLYLQGRNTASCGTVRSNRKKMPKFEQENKEKVQKFMFPPLLAMKYKDKREVHLQSTVYEGKMVNTGKEHWLTKEPILKPDIVIDYNINMRLVDKSDTQVGTIDSLRKSMKWYKKLFFHFMDLSLLNAHHLYILQKGKKIFPRNFSLALCKQILAKHGMLTMNVSHRVSCHNPPDRLLAAAYISRHHIAPCPRQRCHMCYKKDLTTKRVSQWCVESKVALCHPCFVIYHTQEFF